jgi:hypothetical protein
VAIERAWSLYPFVEELVTALADRSPWHAAAQWLRAQTKRYVDGLSFARAKRIVDSLWQRADGRHLVGLDP